MRRFLFLIVAFAGCAFDFSKTENLGDGEIRASVVRADGTPATRARASLQGSDRVTQTADGAIVFTQLVPGRWLMKIGEDEDGDGVLERGAYHVVDLARAAVPKNLTDGCAGEPANVVTSVITGDIALEDTGAIAGTVTLDDGAALGADERARVVVWRDVDGFATQIEAAAGVALDGSFRIDGVLPGRVHVAAFVFDALVGPNGPTLFGQGEVDVESGADADGDIEAAEDALLEGGGPRTTPVQVEAQWTQPEPAAVEIVQVSYTAPGSGALIGAAPGINPAPGFTIEEDARAFVLDPPIGVIEVLLSSATQGAADGVLRGAAIVPGAAPQGPVELPLLADRCVVADDPDNPDARDCDHDGVLGLPFPTGLDDAAWVACAAACKDAFAAAAVCDVGGEDRDCDDDGDGQPDVTEPIRCFGPGLGTDLDADDRCEPFEDPFPYCTEDACDVPAFTPPPSRYEP